MTKEQLLSNKTKLEKGVNNPNLTDAQKELAKKRLAEIEAKLADLEKEESKEPESKEPAKEAAKKGDKRSVADAGAPTLRAVDSLQVKAKKKPKEHKEQFKSDCTETLAKVRALLGEHNAKKPKKPAKPATRKRTSEVLADGIISITWRAIKRELTLDKVGNIKVERVEAARDHFIEALQDMKIGLGGIANDNQSFISDFKKLFNDLIVEVKERQKKVETRADAKIVAGQQAA